jgi:hypothetical protein
MAAHTHASIYSLLRQSCRLLNKQKGKFGNVSWTYIVRKVRSGDTSGTSGVSDSIVELNEFATYLKTTQSHKLLLLKYKGRGERSIEESANLVGLELPEKA